MDQGIAAGIRRLKKILQVHVHGTFRRRSIVVDERRRGICFAGALRTGGGWLRYGGVIRIRGWIRLCGQSRASQNDDGFAGIIGQTFCERENLEQRLASADLENAGASDRSHHRKGMVLHSAQKNTPVGFLNMGRVKKFREEKSKFGGSKPRRSNRPEQGQ